MQSEEREIALKAAAHFRFQAELLGDWDSMMNAKSVPQHLALRKEELAELYALLAQRFQELADNSGRHEEVVVAR